ncbi:MAG: DUF3971 domain-containing protein, partial [Pseudomonadota bacterium]
MSETEADQQSTAKAATRARRHRRRHDARHWLFWLRAGLVACLMPLVFVAAAAVMIIERDISAPSWIVSELEARTDEVLSGGTLEFGAISMRIGRDLHPTVRLRDTQVIDSNGQTLARIPLVEGLISPRGIIFQQRALAQEVRLVGAQINLRRSAEGDVALALVSGGADLGQADNVPALLDQFDQVFERPTLAALEMVQADGLIINFDDARAGRRWVVDGGRASLDLRGGQTVIRGDFALLSGRADVTTVTASYMSPRGARTAELALNLTNAVASDLAAQSPALGWLRDVEAPIRASLRSSLDAEGALGPLNAALEIGAGVLQPNPATAAIAFDGAQAYFTYDPVRDRVSFSEASIETEWGAFRARGDAYLREFRNGLPRALLAQFHLEDIAINPPGFYDVPPDIAAASVDLRLRFEPFRVDVGQLVITDGETRLLAHGVAAATDAGWDLALDATLNEITPERAVALWPNGIKPGTRKWFSERVVGGVLRDGVVGLRRAPEQAARIAVGFAFADNDVTFMRSMPTIRQARGVGSIIDDRFVVTLDDGVMTAPQGGPVRLGGSSFTMVDMRTNPSPAVVDLKLDSSITAALSVINQPPFEFVDRG